MMLTPGADSHSRHGAIMDALKLALDQLLDVIPKDRPIVYLDYPLHNNVGDLLIHAGADAFFDDHQHEVLGRYNVHDFCRRPVKTDPAIVFKPSIRDLDQHVAKRDPVLVLHGGGNLGDIYPEFQQFREMIVERYSSSRIVILPQSVHFQDLQARARAGAVFAAHPDLHIFVRDVESQAFVTEDCKLPVVMLPDMAHRLWGRLPRLTSFPAGELRTLRLRRRDPEAVGHEKGFDWDDLESSIDRPILKVIRKWQLIDNPLRHTLSNYRLWKPFRDYAIRRAVVKFGRYERIDTDRLHGVILGALMGRDVRYGDGSYGKLHRYVGRWLATSPLLTSALARN